MAFKTDRIPTISMVGECMVELREEADGRLVQGFGGDVLNTAIYLSRLLDSQAQVFFATLMGDDSYSKELIDQWKRENICCDLIGCKEGGRPGLYIIQTDEHGERSFHYWRSASPARDFMKPEWQILQDKTFACDWIYLSGISLAILDEKGRKRLLIALKGAQNAGKKIVFDGNYRSLLWSSKQSAKYWYEQCWRLCHMALAGAEDEQSVFGDQTSLDTLTRLQNYGIGEIVVKQGVGPVLLGVDGEQTELPVTKTMHVLDTTAAGDSFNAGYLSGRLTGKTAAVSAKIGAKLASIVIQHPGAIISKPLMPVV